jgi:hypothetical protein
MSTDRDTEDVTIEVGEDDVFDLFLGVDGKPVSGEVEVEVVSESPALHTQFGPRDVRVSGVCRVLGSGERVSTV